MEKRSVEEMAAEKKLCTFKLYGCTRAVCSEIILSIQVRLSMVWLLFFPLVYRYYTAKDFAGCTCTYLDDTS